VSLRFKLKAKFSEIVNLTVENDPGLSVGAAHRLIRRLAKITNLQAPERKARARRSVGAHFTSRSGSGDPALLVDNKKALTIGPAMRDHRMHGEQTRNQTRRIGRVEENTDAAHEVKNLSLRDRLLNAAYSARFISCFIFS
jgi:hypothetical protein